MITPKCVRRNQAFAADRAEAALYGMHGVEANFANRKAGNPDQGFAANAAIGGE